MRTKVLDSLLDFLLDFLLDLLLNLLDAVLNIRRLLLCLFVSGLTAFSLAYNFEAFTVGYGIALLVAGCALGLYLEFRARG